LDRAIRAAEDEDAARSDAPATARSS